MLHAVITTIQEPTPSVHLLVERLAACGGKLIVAGDSKGPASFEGPPRSNWPVEFLSLADQGSKNFELAKHLPTKHYARKNIAYLQAISATPNCIYETDDDNAPTDAWDGREEMIQSPLVLPKVESRWVNIYRFFSRENIWPRGLPLDEILSEAPKANLSNRRIRAPIQQGLVNGSPDVDAIWRLALDRKFEFDNGRSIYLEPGNWCPFNTQTTWWWPLAYPLLYIPSYCSFRMCDIWKSFIAQRCLWALDLGIAFHAPEVVQNRNMHDLNRDFTDEIPGYQNNRRIAEILTSLELDCDAAALAENLRSCYIALVAAAIFPENELDLVDAWLSDVRRLT